MDETILESLRQELLTRTPLDTIPAGRWHVPPRMEGAVPMLDEWIEGYANKELLGEDVFSVAAWMHFGFESIQPFSDGNGRVGRLLLNLHFLKHNWPPVHILPSDKD